MKFSIQYIKLLNRVTFLYYLTFFIVPIVHSQVTPTGAFTNNISIDVPPFHDIEPNLSINYNSHRGNGWLGVGWTLSGFSSIQRTSPGKGVPNYDNTDVFYLDGMELIPCGAGTISPSCDFPASPNYNAFATKIESFERVAFDPTVSNGGAWYVWRKNGTKTTYKPRLNNARLLAYAWDVETIEDPLGNKVTYNYNYWQDRNKGESYLDEILYNGTVIKFFYEIRPDSINYGIGYDLVNVRYRLKTIDVKVGSNRARVYEMKYVLRSVTQRSFLSEVRQFGTDAIVDLSGNISNAQSILSISLITLDSDTQSDPYFIREDSSVSAGLPKINDPKAPVFNWITFPVTSPYDRFTPSNLGDVDGNGQTDWIQAAPDIIFNTGVAAQHTEVLITVALAGKTPPIYVQTKLTWGFQGFIKQSNAADINGDGRSDLVFIIRGEQIPGENIYLGPYFMHLAVALSSGDGTFVWASSNSQITAWETRDFSYLYGVDRVSRYSVGDVDGDGRDDVVCSFTKSDGTHFLGTALSKGDGTFDVKETLAPFADQGETRLMSVGDANGDGLSDALFLDFPHCPAGTSNCTVNYELVTALSNGNGNYLFLRQITLWEKGSPTFFAADINGDGKADFVLFKAILEDSGADGAIQTAIGTNADGTYALNEQVVPAKLRSVDHSVSIGDANGDGKDDLLILSKQAPGKPDCSTTFQNTHVNLHRILSKGNGFFQLPATFEDCLDSREVDITWDDIKYTPVEPQAGDINGDGTADFIIAIAKPGATFTTLREDISDPPSGDTYHYKATEINGDGRKDWVYIRNTITGPYIQVLLSRNNTYVSRGMSPIPKTQRFTALRNWKVMDVDGDGREDMVYLFYLSSTEGIQVSTWLSKGDGTFQFVTKNAFPGVSETCRNTSAWQQIDISGDGKIDLVYVSQENGKLKVMSLISKGNGTWTTYVDEPLTQWTATNILSWRPADINGDGKADLTYLEYLNPGVRVHSLVSKGDGSWVKPAGSPVEKWTSPNTLSSFELFNTQHWKITDVNGDGMSDLVHLSPNDRQTGNSSRLSVHTLLSHGDGTWTDNYSQTSSSFKGDMLNWFSAQVNNDNRGDFVHINIEVPKVIVTTLSSSASGSWSLSVPDTNSSNASSIRSLNSAFFKVADLDGNGQEDLTLFDLSSSGMLMFSLISNFQKDLVNTVTGQYGGKTYVEYKPSSHADINYLNTAAASQHCFLPAGTGFNIVSAVTLADGRSDSAEKRTYEYNGAYWSYKERSFLGFEQIYSHRPPAINRPGSTTFNRFQILGQCFVQPAYFGTLDNNGKWVGTRVIISYVRPGTFAPFKSLVDGIRKVGEVNLQEHAINVQTDYAYDAFGNVKNIFEYGNILSNTDDRTTTITYNPAVAPFIVGLPWQIVVSEGIRPIKKNLRLTYFCYDGQNGTDISNCPGLPLKGLLTRIQVVDDLGLYVNTTYAYDSYGNCSSQMNANHAGKANFFDPIYHIYPIAAVNAMSQSTYLDWNTTTGQVLKISNLNGDSTNFVYDPLGRLISVTLPNRTIHKRQYLNWGDPNLQHIRDVDDDGSTDGLWTETYFDGLGRPYQIIKKGDSPGTTFVQQIIFSDATSLVYKQSHWYRPDSTAPMYEVFTYDNADRLVRQTHPDSKFLRWVYGNTSELRWVDSYDELGKKKSIYTDAFNRVTQISEKSKRGSLITRYTYNSVDELLTIKDGNGNSTINTWDIQGRNIKTVNPDLGTRSYQYDLVGNLVRQIDDKADTIAFTYDAINRLKTKTYPGGKQVLWNYDEAGHGASRGMLTSVIEPPNMLLTTCPGGLSESYSYNKMGQVISTLKCIDGSSYTMNYEFDTIGRLRKMIYPDGEAISYSYDLAGRVNQLSGLVNSLSYDAEDKIRSVNYANGVLGSFDYDSSRNWLKKITVKLANFTLFDASYTYLANGLMQKSSSTTNKMNLTFTHDGFKRLTQVNGDFKETFRYDLVGNMTYNSNVGLYKYPKQGTNGCVINGTVVPCRTPHGASQVGTLKMIYDKNGNLSSVEDTSTGKFKAIDWSYDHKPAVISNFNGLVTHYHYDGGANLVMRQQGNQYTRYYSPFVEYSFSSQLSKYYYIGSLLVARKDQAGIYYFHPDQLGSTRLITDQNGTVVARYDYRAFGDTIGVTANIKTDIQYTGHRIDSDNGLINMQARYYDPKLSIFISPDPIIPDMLNQQALNHYSYVYNNPLVYNDPTGLQPADAGIERFAGRNASTLNLSFERSASITRTVGTTSKSDILSSTVKRGIETQNAASIGLKWSALNESGNFDENKMQSYDPQSLTGTWSKKTYGSYVASALTLGLSTSGPTLSLVDLGLTSYLYERGAMYGDWIGGLTTDLAFKGPGAEGTISIKGTKASAALGATLVSARLSGGFNILGLNIGLFGEPRLGAKFGFAVGSETAVHGGLLSGGITVGAAKTTEPNAGWMNLFKDIWKNAVTPLLNTGHIPGVTRTFAPPGLR